MSARAHGSETHLSALRAGKKQGHLQGFLCHAAHDLARVVAARLLPGVHRHAAVRQREVPICRLNSAAGATGLEPATSGVTGQFERRDVDDGGHRIALFMRSLRGVPERLAWLSGAGSDDCCPFAARNCSTLVVCVDDRASASVRGQIGMGQQQSQLSPRQLATPSLAAMAAITSAAMGSAHHHPKSAFASSPASSAIER